MKDTLISTLIGRLSDTERRRARQFLASPYHNRREDVRRLFDLLEEYLHHLQVAPEREAVYKKIYGEGAYDDQQLRLLASYLLRALETFLRLEELFGRSNEEDALLLAAYRRRRLDRHFQKTLRRARKQLDRRPLRHPEYHYASFQLERQQYQLLSTAGRTRDLNLQPLEDELHRAFLSMKLRQACLALSHQSVYKTEYRLALSEEILAEAARPEYEDVPAVRVYYLGARSLRRPEREDYFRGFREELLAAFDRFPPAEQRDLLLIALNFCIRRINEGQPPYLREALALYRRGLDDDLLLEAGKLSRFTYNNVTGIALRLAELDWAETFVEQYRDELDPDYREATYNLNAARLAYARRDFDRALRHLQQADYRDLINNLVAKTLQLKIYYESGEYDLLDAHLRTMRSFLRRQRRLGYHQRNYLNIVRLTRKLLTSNPYDRQARAQLRAEIEGAEPLTEKGWLLEQL